MNLGLALIVAMLWQGTFAQPQLDGRYGVDRVAMDKQAKEAAGKQRSLTLTSGTSGTITMMTSDYEIEPTHTCPKGYDLVPGQAFDVRDHVWKCRKNSTWVSPKNKASKN